MSDTDKETQEQDSNSLSLSEALLAPLNSIFKAQIHASRAFLSFLLQMGFRHKYSPEELAEINSKPEENRDIIQQIKEEEDGKKTIKELRERLNELNNITTPTPEEQKERSETATALKEANAKWGDLYQQTIEYLDPNGNDRILSIPNLALLPIKPLAIQNANFKFELRVKDEIKSSNSTIRSSTKADPKRPWFLIDDPKSIQGEFVPQQKENSTDKTIKIDVTIGAVDMPYGLHKLISSLVNTADDSERSNNATN